METQMLDEDNVVGPLLSLRSLQTTVWRRRRIWLLTALLGLLIGSSLHLVLPPKYEAVTDLYIAQPSGTDPSQATLNDISLLETQMVAKQAITTDHLHLSPTALLSHYFGISASENIMSIDYSAGSEADAISGDKAIGQAFLAVLAQELRLQTNVLVDGLQSQISSLNAAINHLNNSISSLSATPPDSQNTNNVTELVNQRGSDEQQVGQLQSQMQQATLNEQSTDDASNVLDPAAVVPASKKKVLLEDGLTGLIAGLALGLAFVVLSSLLSERPISRSMAAREFGTSVELSLERFRGRRFMSRRRLSRQLRNPSPVVAMIGRRLRNHVESVPGSALAIVELGSAEPAALAVGALALRLASEGHRVVVVDASERRLLASALGVTSKPKQMETFEVYAGGDSPMTIIVAPEDPAQMAQKPPPDDADALLVLGTLDPAFGAEHLASWVTDAVMILSAKGVSLTRMQVSRDMLRDAGIFLRSLILLGSDGRDETSGALSSADGVTPGMSLEPSR
jgi:subunit length determinant Wzz-like protein